MKKQFCIILTCAFLLGSLSGCGDNKSSGNTNSTQNSHNITIDSAIGDVFGTGKEYTIDLNSTAANILPGTTDISTYEEFSLKISGNGKDETIPLSIDRSTYAYPKLFLGDFTGDGISDILVELPVIGGTRPCTLFFIYSYQNGKIAEILNADKINSNLTYTVTRKDNYITQIYSEALKKTFSIEFSEYYKHHPDQFIFEESSSGNSLPMYDAAGKVNPNIPRQGRAFLGDIGIFNDVTSVTGVAKSFDIYIRQDLWGSARWSGDFVGDLFSVLKWDDVNKKFTVTQQVFDPFYEYVGKN